jgi:hypothetical protein
LAWSGLIAIANFGFGTVLGASYFILTLEDQAGRPQR